MITEITFDSFFPSPLSLFRDRLLPLPRPEVSSGILVLDPGVDLPSYLVLIRLKMFSVKMSTEGAFTVPFWYRSEEIQQKIMCSVKNSTSKGRKTEIFKPRLHNRTLVALRRRAL